MSDLKVNEGLLLFEIRQLSTTEYGRVEEIIVKVNIK